MGDINYDRDTLAYQQANRRFRQAQTERSLYSPNDGSSRGCAWGQLDNTYQEITTIGGLLRGQGYQTDTLSGLQASEEAFLFFTQRPEGSPRVAHLATHGFFYEAPASRQPNRPGDAPEPAFVQSQDALVRSGLVLAGANRVWQGGPVPAGEQDGVLTAYEISLLNLRNTELVVLSACETGLGDVRGSEGVYGLQRAFKIAGAQNLIMSLWQVNDKATRRLMERFYGYYLRDGQPIRAAFDRAVTDMKTDYEPYEWAAFVLVE